MEYRMTKFIAKKDNNFVPHTHTKKGDVIEVKVYISNKLPAGEIIINKSSEFNYSQKNFLLDENFYDNYISLKDHRKLEINKILKN